MRAEHRKQHKNEIESYKAATPLVQKIGFVDVMIREGSTSGKMLRLSILNQNGTNANERIDVSKVEDFTCVGLWNLLCGYQKYLHKQLKL